MNKNYEVVIKDKLSGKEFKIETEFMNMVMSRGIDKIFGNMQLVDLVPNGKFLCVIKLWDGDLSKEELDECKIKN